MSNAHCSRSGSLAASRAVASEESLHQFGGRGSGGIVAQLLRAAGQGRHVLERAVQEDFGVLASQSERGDDADGAKPPSAPLSLKPLARCPLNSLDCLSLEGLT